jgi:hypothetical protein
MLQEKYVRLKIKDIVERELGFNFIGLFDGGISDVYTLTEFVTYFIDSSKETEIRIYNIFSYHF